MGKRMDKLILFCISFLAGFAVMGYEILGMRFLFPYWGSSIYVIGAIISVFLAGLSAGYAVGGKIADSPRGSRHLPQTLALPAAIMLFFPLYGRDICNSIYALGLESRTGALLASAILFLAPCVLIGSAIPIIVCLLARIDGHTGSAAGNTYATSTAGSIAGTIFTSFFLISWITVPGGIALLGLLLSAAAAFSFWKCLHPGTAEPQSSDDIQSIL